MIWHVAWVLQVTAVNPWLNYSMPFHRVREWGLHKRVFDLLDERSLSVGEVRETSCVPCVLSSLWHR